MYIQIRLDITEEQVLDMLITGFEGGSNYWYSQLAPRKETSKKDNSTDRFYDNLLHNGFELVDKEDNDKKYTVTPAAIRKAVSLMYAQERQHFANWIDGNGDAITGDVFIQLAVFGKVIYG